MSTAQKIELIQQQSKEFSEKMQPLINEVVFDLGYHKGSVFSYNIDRLLYFVNGLDN